MKRTLVWPTFANSLVFTVRSRRIDPLTFARPNLSLAGSRLSVGFPIKHNAEAQSFLISNLFQGYDESSKCAGNLHKDKWWLVLVEETS
jgi:hypothetical protein